VLLSELAPPTGRRITPGPRHEYVKPLALGRVHVWRGDEITR